MDRWYEIAKDSARDDGSRRLDYIMVFETEDKNLKKKIENFYKSLIPTDNLLLGQGD